MKVKILEFNCKPWCIGKTGDAKRYDLPEPGLLVTFQGNCPHKGPNTGTTTCFFENRFSKVEILGS